MTGSLDPWRTLGLTPGASIDDIRRAYRRLAKINHPDAAGESALPRFLAIQSAYEALAGPHLGRRPGGRPARGAGAAQRDGTRDPASGSGPNTAGRARGEQSNRAGSAGGGGVGGAGTRGRTQPGDPGASRRTGGRRRPPNRATPGSTSYDAADEEPFEPGWGGATWYGASSGTYWTINPKEYADPRKHGPEYQRRARRSASGGWILDDDPGAEPDGSGPPGPDRGADRDAATRRARWPDDPAAARDPDSPTGPGTTASDRGRSRGSAGPQRPTWTSAGESAAGEARPSTGDRPASGGSGRDAERLGRHPGDSLAGSLLRLTGTPAGRLGLALLGWPPLGVAAATVIGETTGCSRFAASCAEVFSPGVWIVQLAILLVLLALPRIAGWSAVGTLASLAAAIPTAVFLSAGGGSRQAEASAGVLLAVLGLAYVVGVAWAVARQGWPTAGRGRVP